MPALPARKQSVFIADDDADMRALLRLILRADGYDVIGEAGSGDRVLEACLQARPQVLLLDINMPGLDGIEVLEKARAGLPRTRIIMISAGPTLDRVTDALRKGADGFIVKPFNAAKLLDDIRDVPDRQGG